MKAICLSDKTLHTDNYFHLNFVLLNTLAVSKPLLNILQNSYISVIINLLIPFFIPFDFKFHTKPYLQFFIPSKSPFLTLYSSL